MGGPTLPVKLHSFCEGVHIARSWVVAFGLSWLDHGWSPLAFGGGLDYREAHFLERNSAERSMADSKKRHNFFAGLNNVLVLNNYVLSNFLRLVLSFLVWNRVCWPKWSVLWFRLGLHYHILWYKC